MAVRVVSATNITKTVANLCISANINADENIRAAIYSAHNQETSAPAKHALNMMLQNMDIAKDEKMPLCQDTGMVVVFAEIGQDIHIDGNLTHAIQEGVRQGYKEGYFRASVVQDPIYRTNTKDNTPAIIHYDIVEGTDVKITVMPKGFGSENKSALKMLNPSDGIAGVEKFVLDTVKAGGSSPCPPIVVGVGVGGTMEKAALLAKQALLLDIPQENPSPFWAQKERELLVQINALGIGAAGFGGGTTALAVKILTHATHIAGLPVAVNIGCHVSRHAQAII